MSDPMRAADLNSPSELQGATVHRGLDPTSSLVSPHFFAAVTMTLYLLSTTASPLSSTHRWVKAFGFLALLTFGYKEKPTFAVENEKEIAKPPSVGFDTAPAKPAGPGTGASK